MQRLIFSILIMSSCTQQADIEYLAVGSYTQKEGHVDGKAEGIYIIGFDRDNGTIHIKDTIPGLTNPSYLEISKDGKLIYAVNETIDTHYNSNGYISIINKQDNHPWAIAGNISSEGAYPCYVHLDNENDQLYVSNYMNTVSVFDVGLSETPMRLLDVIHIPVNDSLSQRQDSPHPHLSLPINNGKNLLISDLGGNKIYNYENRQDQWLAVDSVEMEHHAGPRHLVYHKDNQMVYVLNELNNTIEVVEIQRELNKMNKIQVLPLLKNIHQGQISSAAIHMDSKGLFLYSSQRGHDNIEDNMIMVCAIDKHSGQLSIVQRFQTMGQIPRDFILSSDGQYILVAHQDSDNIMVFKRDSESGEILEKISQLNIPTPVCLKYFLTYN